MRRLLGVLLGTLVLGLLLVPSASAHDELVSSVPGNGFTVNDLPAMARFTFAEETPAEDLTVKADGKSLPVAAFPGDPKTLTADLSGVAAKETVSLDWRVVDAHDGHVTTGVLAFHVLNHSDATPAPTPAAAPTAAVPGGLVSSVPANAFTVNTLPAVAKLTFDKPLSPEELTVTSAGARLPVAAVPGDASSVSVALAKVAATETVKLDWTLLRKGATKPITGAVSFHVLDHVDAPAPTATPAAVVPGGLVSSVPANTFTVNALPATAKLTFDRPTAPKQVTVTVGGQKRPVTAVAGDPASVSVDLSGVRATETVKLSWSVLRPGAKKPVTGVLAFHLLDHVAGTAAAGGPDKPLHTLSVTVHVIGYVAMAVLLGGLFFVSVLWPAGARDRRTRVLLGSAAAVGLAAALTGVYVVTDQASPLSFRDAIAQHFGRVSVAVALMWLLASVVVAAVLQQPDSVRRAPWRVGAVVVAIGMIRSIGMSAHGTQGSHATTGVLIDFLHLTAVSAWVGGLAVMVVGLLPRRQLSELEAVVPRFSKVAATSVVLVVLSGVLLAWQLIGSFGGLFSTHYGHVLIVKLVLLGLVLLAALASKRWVEQRLDATAAAGDSRAVATFIASVSAEAVLVIAVLGVASVLVTSSPGL